MFWQTAAHLGPRMRAILPRRGTMSGVATTVSAAMPLSCATCATSSSPPTMAAPAADAAAASPGLDVNTATRASRPVPCGSVAVPRISCSAQTNRVMHHK